MGSQIKPWHIIVLALAIIFVLWRVSAYVKEQRAQHGTYYAPQNPITPSSAPQFQRIKERNEAEK